MRAPLLLLTILASVAPSAQPVRPDWDVVRVGVAADELTPDDIARQLDAEAGAPGDDREPRGFGHRLAIVGISALPLASSEAINGSASAVRNEWGWCVDRHGRGGQCLPLLHDFHARRTVARVLLAGGLTTTAYIVSSEDLTAAETTALLAASLMTAKVAYDVGYNLEAGNPLSYEGTVARSDQLARRIGTDAVWIGTNVILVGLHVLANQALR